MRMALEEIKNKLNDFNIGDMINVVVPNGTAHYGAPRYYNRIGNYNGIAKDKYGRDSVSVLIGAKKKNYKFALTEHWMWNDNQTKVYDGKCSDILWIEKV